MDTCWFPIVVVKEGMKLTLEEKSFISSPPPQKGRNIQLTDSYNSAISLPLRI